MASNEELMKNLHETFLQLRYPGLAQASSGNITETILTQENRLFLLSWILSLFKPEEFSDNHDEAKIIRWYSDLGICDNPDVLMGRVPLAEQVSLLKNLLLFMKNVQSADDSKIDSDSCNQLDILDLYKECMNISTSTLPSTCGLTKEMTYPEAIQYLDECRESLNENEITSNGEFISKEDEMTNETLDSTVSTEYTEASRKENIAKFLEAFDDCSLPKSEDLDKLVPTKSMDDYIDQICSNMEMLKQTFKSKDEISNSVIEHPLESRDMPLDPTIEDIVIAIEELSHAKDMD